MNTLFAGIPIPEDVVNVQRARRHLASLSPERRAQLEQEWAEAEFHREPISADIRARAAKEWTDHAESELVAAIEALESNHV